MFLPLNLEGELYRDKKYDVYGDAPGSSHQQRPYNGVQFQPQAKPLSANRRDRTNKSGMEYGGLSDNSYGKGGFNDFGGLADREKEEKRKRINKQKEMLLQQIEEQKRQKDEAKRRRLQEEQEEEERIRREIETLNAREKNEAEEKKNKQKQFRQNLDEDTEKKNQNKRNNRPPPPPNKPEPNRRQNDIPPEFQELASTVERQQQKQVNFEQFPTNHPNIPKGDDMFKNTDFKGTNTQRLNEIQLKFQNEVGGLKSEINNKHHEIMSLVNQLKEAQDQLK